jgi:hypothetical protein
MVKNLEKTHNVENRIKIKIKRFNKVRIGLSLRRGIYCLKIISDRNHQVQDCLGKVERKFP